MKEYKYLLFDADNTIFDFDRSEHEALKQTFASFGIALSEEQHSVYHGINDALWKKLEKGEVTRDKLKTLRFAQFLEYLGRDDVDPCEAASLYVETLSDQSFLIDGAYEVCEQLSGFYPLYLITNGITSVQKKRFIASPVKKFFETVFISEEMGCAKPALEYFQKVCEAIGDDDASHYIVIGDSLSSDIRGASNFGCDSVWVCRDGTASDIATYTVDSLSKIIGILNVRG